MTEDVKANALHYLETHQVMTLATVGAAGVWAAAVFYVNDGFDLYFLSAGHTRHAQNFAVEPRVAATIQEDYQDWTAIQGIQLEGNILLLTGAVQETAVALYQKKFPFLSRPIPQIVAALAQVKWYRLRPERFYFIDNTKGLGHRDEVPLNE